MDYNEIKLKMLKDYNVLEEEKSKIMQQGQQMQAKLQQISVAQNTLNIRLKFIEELEEPHKEVE